MIGIILWSAVIIFSVCSVCQGLTSALVVIGIISRSTFALFHHIKNKYLKNS